MIMNIELHQIGGAGDACGADAVADHGARGFPNPRVGAVGGVGILPHRHERRSVDLLAPIVPAI